MKRFLAFDIETAKILPEKVDDLLAYRPLGIACAAAMASDFQQPLIWHGQDESGHPTPQMTSMEAAQLVLKLSDLASQGYTICTWNGLGFDFDVLAEESGRREDCARLAQNHVDMLFHFLCSQGYLISLQRASEGMHLTGKREGISGAKAPVLWAAGRYKEVLEYCVQDVRLTLQLAEACERSRHLTWITQKGKLKKMSLSNGWLTVNKAKTLPLPDTSWMNAPPSRERFLRWILKTKLA